MEYSFDMRFSLFLIIIIYHSICHADTFRVEGSDLVMGVGAESIAMAGAVSARVDDIYAIYWNPAGLADSQHSNLSISRQLDGKLIDVSFAGVSTSYVFNSLKKLKATFAFALIQRLSIRASGRFQEGDIESLFLDYALPEIPDDFAGHVNSKTKEYRFAIGILPSKNSPWRFGSSVGLIKCGTSSCGVNAKDPDNYLLSSTEATAITMSFGLKYDISDQIRFAVNIKDFNTTLEVETLVNDNNGERREIFTTSFPHDMTTGLSWDIADNVNFNLDYQSLWGKYGSHDIDFRLIRAGLEHKLNSLSLRIGALIPLYLYTDTTGNLVDNAPAPFFPSAGIGWKSKMIIIDFAIFPHPVKSHIQHTIEINSDLNITLFW